MRKRTRFPSEMSIQELENLSREFDAPDYEPRFAKATAQERAAHQRADAKALQNAAAQRIHLVIDRKLLEEAGEYAASHGVPLNDVFIKALLRFIKRKSA